MAEGPGLARPPWLASSWLLAAVAGALVVALAIVYAATGRGAPSPGASDVQQIIQVQRSDGAGATTAVTLPDEIDLGAVAATRTASARYRWSSELGAQPHALALYASGLLARATLRVNGRTIVDELRPPPRPRPRGSDAVVLFELPDDALQPGR